MKWSNLILLAVLALGLGACGPATQNIPVSSNPAGATVFADGKEVCQTPCEVTLTRTQAHVLTLKHDGYEQSDVRIKQVYDTAGVARDATAEGLQASANGANPEGAVANALLSAGYQEGNGMAYDLSPTSVVVKMTPVGGAASGAKKVAEADNVKTTEPATMTKEIEDNPEDTLKDVAKEAAAAGPTVGGDKTWKKSHTSKHHEGDGSYSETKTSTSASVGVHVNPVEAGLEAVDLLEKAAGGDSGSDSESDSDSDSSE
ncbi:PEGA domain-containing protein [Desulfohalovibrio reitneri]|uniref:PEGA domain-containing protein n=1 Tax=Desulfohalovibrio reitneri TaxID=1307759 RepID=UPI00068B166A|nr:PEGA domain-containing protein [Desulfohalovibrio reitneri]